MLIYSKLPQRKMVSEPDCRQGDEEYFEVKVRLFANKTNKKTQFLRSISKQWAEALKAAIFGIFLGSLLIQNEWLWMELLLSLCVYLGGSIHDEFTKHIFDFHGRFFSFSLIRVRFPLSWTSLGLIVARIVTIRRTT